MTKLNFSKIFQFGAVGFTGVIIDLGVTWILKEQFYFNPYLASCFGFTIAVLNNYILNKYWTFQEKGKLSLSQFLGFLFVSIGGLILNTYCVKFCHGILGIDFYLSKLIAIGVVVAWNFIANSLFVFKNKKKYSATKF